MSRLVNTLEQRNLARRQRDTTDRRVVHISATEDGERLLTAGRQRRVGVLADRLATLAPSDQATINQAVSLIEALLHPKTPRPGETLKG